MSDIYSIKCKNYNTALRKNQVILRFFQKNFNGGENRRVEKCRIINECYLMWGYSQSDKQSNRIIFEKTLEVSK